MAQTVIVPNKGQISMTKAMRIVLRAISSLAVTATGEPVDATRIVENDHFEIAHLTTEMMEVLKKNGFDIKFANE